MDFDVHRELLSERYCATKHPNQHNCVGRRSQNGIAIFWRIFCITSHFVTTPLPRPTMSLMSKARPQMNRPMLLFATDILQHEEHESLTADDTVAANTLAPDYPIRKH